MSYDPYAFRNYFWRNLSAFGKTWMVFSCSLVLLSFVGIGAVLVGIVK